MLQSLQFKITRTPWYQPLLERRSYTFPNDYIPAVNNVQHDGGLCRCWEGDEKNAPWTGWKFDTRNPLSDARTNITPIVIEAESIQVHLNSVVTCQVVRARVAGGTADYSSRK